MFDFCVSKELIKDYCAMLNEEDAARKVCRDFIRGKREIEFLLENYSTTVGLGSILTSVHGSSDIFRTMNVLVIIAEKLKNSKDMNILMNLNRKCAYIQNKADKQTAILRKECKNYAVNTPSDKLDDAWFVNKNNEINAILERANDVKAHLKKVMHNIVLEKIRPIVIKVAERRNAL